MRIYVASKFENQDEVRTAMKKLESLGHTITYDWTRESYEGKSSEEIATYRVECALNDVNGVRTADALVLINHPLGKGMFVEMGLAIAWGKAIFVVYPERVDNIFACLPGVGEYSDINEAIEALDDWAVFTQHLNGTIYREPL